MSAHPKKTSRHAKRALLAALVVSLAFVPSAWAHDDDDDYGDGYYADDEDSYYDDGGYSDDTWADGYYEDAARDPAPFRPSSFPSLRGHGSWDYVPTVGFLWFPHVSSSWRPYFYGHWVPTSYGMTWVSYEPWGHIPHHYGRWIHTARYGWGWVPGYDYGPAWVTWGVGIGHVGWAPLPPAGFRYRNYHRYSGWHRPVDYGFHGSFGYHSSGIDFGLWVFVSNDHFYGSSVHRHALPRRHSLSLFKHKKITPVGSYLDVRYAKKITPKKFKTVKADKRKIRVGDRSVVYHEPRGQKSRVKEGRNYVRKNVVRDGKSPDRVRRSSDRRVSKDRALVGKFSKVGKSTKAGNRVVERNESSKKSRQVVKKSDRSKSVTRQVAKAEKVTRRVAKKSGDAKKVTRKVTTKKSKTVERDARSDRVGEKSRKSAKAERTKKQARSRDAKDRGRKTKG